MEGQNEKDYTPKMTMGKEMANMLTCIPGFSKSNANGIVVYFGLSRIDKFADFGEAYLKDSFV